MTAVNLTDVLAGAENGHYAIAGFVVLGFDDAVAFVEAAEETGIPVIIQAGPGYRAHTPIDVIGTMFRMLAERANVPVVCHLDHAYTKEECLAGIDHGFTSVMFDGSKLPIHQNIEHTSDIVAAAHAANVSVEGEVGFVGYDAGAQSQMTKISEVAAFDRESGADAIAVSVGNVHLQQKTDAIIDWKHLSAIEAVTTKPLVLHGGSGIPLDIRRQLAFETRVCKFNIGTELRMTFGSALRISLNSQPDEFDRIKIMKPVMAEMKRVAGDLLRSTFRRA